MGSSGKNYIDVAVKRVSLDYINQKLLESLGRDHIIKEIEYLELLSNKYRFLKYYNCYYSKKYLKNLFVKNNDFNIKSDNNNKTNNNNNKSDNNNNKSDSNSDIYESSNSNEYA